MNHLWLIPIGLFTGAYASLVGLGGGFIIVPLLLLMYPNEGPAFATSISLAVVFVNGLSGTWAYARMKRINYRIGIMLALGTIPGAVLGAMTTTHIPRRLFELFFGLLLIALTISLLKKPRNSKAKQAASATQAATSAEDEPPSYNLALALTMSVGVGFLASLLGVGGGILFIPFMLYIMRLPIHLATATSMFVLMITSLSATLSHLFAGELSRGVEEMVSLAIGVAVGAQVGAYLSNRVNAVWLIRALALALGVTGLKFVLSAL